MSDEPTEPRQWLAAYLRPLVPETWRIIDSFTLPETLSQPTVTLTHTRIEKDPVSPLVNLVNTISVRIADNKTDVARAENDLDNQVNELLHLLQLSERLRWVDAEKVQIKNTPYYGWDVTVQVLSSI